MPAKLLSWQMQSRGTRQVGAPRQAPSTAMRRHLVWAMCFLLLAGTLMAPPVSMGQQVELVAPTLATHLSRLQVKVVDGRVWVLAQTAGGTISTTTHRDGREERLRLSLHGGVPAIDYDQITQDFHLGISVRDGQYVHILREPQDGTTKIERVEFTQTPGEPVKWSIGADPNQRLWQAPSVWHLFLDQPELVLQQLLPMLELLRPDWQLAATTTETETELLSLASRYPDPRREVWRRLVDQLASDSFAERQRADRALRQAGPAALGFLQSLDVRHLDAEQRFRIRRIVAAVSNYDAEDTPPLIARRLISDPMVWLSMLKRPELAKRRVAVQQLQRIWNRPVDFDIRADPATRRRQWEALYRDWSAG